MITNAAREERGRGVPLNDVERVARHYNISLEEACDLLAVYTVGELLPERGYGLTVPMELTGHTIDDLKVALNAMEDSLPLGGKAKLQLCTMSLPSEADLAYTYLQLTAAGFHTSYPMAGVIQGVPTTEMTLIKGSPQWASLIAIVPTMLIVGLIAFGITRIEAISRALLPILLTVVVGGVVIIGMMRAPAGRIAERAAQRYLPSTQKKVLAAR